MDGKHVLFVIGDWNAKVGSQETPGVTGKFGLGIWNEAGQRLIEFCQEKALVIRNTLFQQHKRRLYTWTSPDGQWRRKWQPTPVFLPGEFHGQRDLASYSSMTSQSLLLCCWKRVFAMTSAFSWQNSISLYPASFCTPSPNLPVTPGIS